MADQRVAQAEPLNHADLREAQLAGKELDFLSLRGANLDGADLSNARLTHVDLSGASLRGALLVESSIQHVRARGADFSGIQAANSFFQFVDLASARIFEADLQGATLHVCLLREAHVDGSDLSSANLTNCDADGASFRGTRLERTGTVGSTFMGADFSDARTFLGSREIVIEVLKEAVGADFEAAKLLGALAIGRSWCFPEWRQILALQPRYREVALEIFRKYPRSGLLEALSGGGDPGEKPSKADQAITEILRMRRSLPT